MSIINNKAYDWADITLMITGFRLEVQEISYDDELEKELVYGMGNKPRGFGTGNYKAGGKLSVLRDDYNDLLAYLSRKKIKLYDLVIDKIVVAYGTDGQPMTVDTLQKVTFTKRSTGGKQGDKSIMVDLDFIIIGQIVTDGTEAI